MDISLKYLHFNLLHNDKILVCQPDIEASWVGRGGNTTPPSITQRRWPTSLGITSHYPAHYPLYYSALSQPSKSTILPRMADISVEYVSVSSQTKAWNEKCQKLLYSWNFIQRRKFQQAKIYLDFNAQVCPHSLHTSILFRISHWKTETETLIYTQYPGY